MRILMQSRIDLFDRRGGDTVQIEKTAEELRKLGVEVEIDCSAKLSLANVDLVHLFNIDWPAQVYLQAKNAKEQDKPIVFSPIHHSYREIERYEKEARFGVRRLTNSILRTRESREKLKEVYRFLTDPRKISSILTEFRKGIINEQRELLEMADLILVQTNAEEEDIKKDFAPLSRLQACLPARQGQAFSEKAWPFEKVVNGVNWGFAEASPDWFVENFGLKDFILSVGRVEPRKNQLAVVNAVEGLAPQFLNPSGSSVNPKGSPCGAPQPLGLKPLIFVGRISWRHPEYALRFLNLVRRNDWIYHIPQIPYEKMGSCYAAAKIHVLASWFETTGLVNLEAALAGANVVSSSGRSREYLQDFGFYCDSGDINSITEAIRRAWETPPDPKFKEHILENFTWEIVGRQTLAAYQKVLNGYH